LIYTFILCVKDYVGHSENQKWIHDYLDSEEARNGHPENFHINGQRDHVNSIYIWLDLKGN
jgi:hypothetical protein